MLIYYLHNKSIHIDVIGWTPEEYEKLKICRRVELRMKNDDNMIKVNFYHHDFLIANNRILSFNKVL